MPILTVSGPPHHRLYPKNILNAWGEFLHRFAWDHLATLTFRYPPSRDSAVRELLHRWIRRLAWNAQQPIPCFYCLERGAAGLLHFHALTGGTAHLTVDQLRWEWKAGFSKIERYDPSRGAAWYVTKGILGCYEWCEITRRLPPMRSDCGETPAESP